jgi:hypothetical protein
MRGVLAGVAREVDERYRFDGDSDGGVGHAGGVSEKGDDRAVVVGVAGGVQQRDAGHRADLVQHRLDDFGIAALADVGHALDDFCHFVEFPFCYTVGIFCWEVLAFSAPPPAPSHREGNV